MFHLVKVHGYIDLKLISRQALTFPKVKAIPFSRYYIYLHLKKRFELKVWIFVLENSSSSLITSILWTKCNLLLNP